MMVNLAKLSLLAALTVGQSLAGDVSPHPLFNRHFQSMGDPKPMSEKFNPGAVPAIEVPRLGKRQGFCPSNWHHCPKTGGCCPTGWACIGEGDRGRCQWLHCESGSYKCTDSLGFCCPSGTECVPDTLKCRKPCDSGSTQCSDGCCEPGYSCHDSNGLCVKILGRRSISITTSVPTTSKAPASDTTLINSFTTIPTTSKAATSSTTLVRPSTTIPTTSGVATPGTTLVNPFTTPPIGPTPTNSDSEPTLPSTTENGGSLNGTESVKTSPRLLTTGLANGSNALNVGGCLRGLGILFFFVFFHA